MTSPRSLLSIHGLSVTYGQVTALNGVSFDVHPGAITGVIGPNGAGKTTLLDAIGGFVGYEGTISLSGICLNGRRPHERARAGLGRTFQAADLHDDLSVLENVSTGASSIRDRRHRARLIHETLRMLSVDHLQGHLAGELSQGTRRLVSVARAVVGRPHVLLLDEPAAGLDGKERAVLADRLRAICSAGVSVVLIDHDVDLVLGVCSDVVVLNFGSVIAHGSPGAIRKDRGVAAAYLGTDPVNSLATDGTSQGGE